jgi:hypothetical protein
MTPAGGGDVVITVLGKLRQEDHEFLEVSLGYIDCICVFLLHTQKKSTYTHVVANSNNGKFQKNVSTSSLFPSFLSLKSLLTIWCVTSLSFFWAFINHSHTFTYKREYYFKIPCVLFCTSNYTIFTFVRTRWWPKIYFKKNVKTKYMIMMQEEFVGIQ